MIRQTNQFDQVSQDDPDRDHSRDLSREIVLMTHGIASTRFFLIPLARRIQRVGFSTKLYGYPSIWWSNESHGKKLAAMINNLAGRYDRVHLVVHSMGGIVTRCALQQPMPENLGNIVMIAPPNRGSHVATQLTWVYGWLSPTLIELRDTPDSFVNQLGPVSSQHRVGVLEASNDNVLRAGQTKIDGLAEHRIVRGWHTGVLWTRETAELTRNFLQTGSFGQPATV